MFYKIQKKLMIAGMASLLAITSNIAAGCQLSDHNGVENVTGADESSMENNKKDNKEDGEDDKKTVNTISFTDDMGREVTVNNPEKVVCLTSSFADIWHVAGGTEQIVATTNATWKYYDIPLGEDVVNLGSSKEVNLEQLIACDPDLVLASCGTDRNVELESLLTEMDITTAYFSVDTIDDYLRMLDICTQITGCEENYVKYGTDVKKHVEQVIERAKQAVEIENQDTRPADQATENEQQDIRPTDQVADQAVGNEQQDTKYENRHAPTVLYIRATGSSCKVKNSKDSILGEMLSDLGCINIADSESSLLEQLSMEVILEQDPEYIFVILQNADTSDEILESTLLNNPAWASLSAVKKGRYHVLDTTLYNMKPNARWGEAYEKLADILYPEQ